MFWVSYWNSSHTKFPDARILYYKVKLLSELPNGVKIDSSTLSAARISTCLAAITRHHLCLISFVSPIKRNQERYLKKKKWRCHFQFELIFLYLRSQRLLAAEPLRWLCHSPPSGDQAARYMLWLKNCQPHSETLPWTSTSEAQIAGVHQRANEFFTDTCLKCLQPITE